MHPSSPTRPLLVGLAIILAAVSISSWFSLRQIEGVRALQSQTIDRGRLDSLQLLRIQGDLHSLGLAMRDMVEDAEPYPLDAWKVQFDRLRSDLEDALKTESRITPSSRSPEQQGHLAESLAQFWNTSDQVFSLAREGKSVEARRLIRTSLESRQAALTALVARFLVRNNEADEHAAAVIQSIYNEVERNLYYLLAAVLVTIAITSLYIVRANRRIFDRLAGLSDQRRTLARKLIGMHEEILHSVSRELHDEFGQVLTAVGALLGRAERVGLPPDSPFRSQVEEVRGIVQDTLDKIRVLSQALHPSILDDYGLEKALEWYVTQTRKQSGVEIRYEKRGSGPTLAPPAAIHVYRILQEALNNVIRHSQTADAWVRVEFGPERLRLEVEDRGVGLPEERQGGLGLIAMRERADLLQGTLEWKRPQEGGTLLVLDVPTGVEVAA